MPDPRPSTTPTDRAFSPERTAAILNGPYSPAGSTPEHQETTTARCDWRRCPHGSRYHVEQAIQQAKQRRVERERHFGGEVRPMTTPDLAAASREART